MSAFSNSSKERKRTPESRVLAPAARHGSRERPLYPGRAPSSRQVSVFASPAGTGNPEGSGNRPAPGASRPPPSRCAPAEWPSPSCRRRSGRRTGTRRGVPDARTSRCPPGRRRLPRPARASHRPGRQCARATGEKDPRPTPSAPQHDRPGRIPPAAWTRCVSVSTERGGCSRAARGSAGGFQQADGLFPAGPRSLQVLLTQGNGTGQYFGGDGQRGEMLLQPVDPAHEDAQRLRGSAAAGAACVKRRSSERVRSCGDAARCLRDALRRCR